MWRLRALLWNDPAIIVLTVIMGTLSLIASLFDRTGRAQHGIARRWARMLLRASDVRVSVEGLDHITPGGSYIIASNHRSYMDIPILLAHIPVQFRFLAKKSLFWIPFIGYHLRRAGHIPVDRQDPRSSLRTMAEAGRTVRECGASLLVFPEGGRTPGEMREFKEGAAYIAIKAGVPLVAVGLAGAREILPMGSLLVRGGHVLVRVGGPIETQGLKLHDRARLTDELRERVTELADAVPRVNR